MNKFHIRNIIGAAKYSRLLVAVLIVGISLLWAHSAASKLIEQDKPAVEETGCDGGVITFTPQADGTVVVSCPNGGNHA
jgi:hypothetical protein